MRHFIIGLSVILFALSGIITFKAFEIPGNKIRYQNSQQSVEPEKSVIIAAENLNKDTKEQKNNRVFFEELLTTTPSVEDKLANENTVTKGEIAKNPEGLSLFVRGVFPSGQVGIDENLMNSLIVLVPHILASPDHRVIIEGHTDNIPIGQSIDKIKDNIELSYLRAKALASVLEKKGVPLERITVIGHGDAFPIASNESKEGRFKNRRVEVKLIPPDKEF